MSCSDGRVCFAIQGEAVLALAAVVIRGWEKVDEVEV